MNKKDVWFILAIVLLSIAFLYEVYINTELTLERDYYREQMLDICGLSNSYRNLTYTMVEDRYKYLVPSELNCELLKFTEGING